MFIFPTALNSVKLFFLSATLTAAFGINALAQQLPNAPTKLPPISNDKTIGKTDLAKDFELRAEFVTDAQGLAANNAFTVTKAFGDAAVLKMAAEGIAILSSGEILQTLREAGFREKIKITCGNKTYARDGEITVTVRTPETVEASFKPNRKLIDRIVDQMFEQQKLLPQTERFLISPVGVLANDTVLSLSFRISVSRAQKILMRVKKSSQNQPERGLVKALQLFLDKPALPPGVYATDFAGEEQLFLDARRARLIERQFQKLTGNDLLDFKTAHAQTYLTPETGAAADFNQQLFYAEQESEWLFAASLIYLQIFDDAQQSGKIVLPEGVGGDELQTLIPELFNEENRADAGKPTVQNAAHLRQLIKQNDLIRTRLSGLYAREPVVRETLALRQSENAAQAAALLEDLRRRPHAVPHQDGGQISQTYESQKRRCTESGCEQSALAFETQSFTLVYSETAKDFKIQNYKTALTRLF